MGLRTRPPGPRWYYECRVCFEEIAPSEVSEGICPNCGVGGSLVKLPMGKPGKHIPQGFAEGEDYDG